MTSTPAFTASRTLTVPAATDAASYTKEYSNFQTGGFTLVISTGSGGTVAITQGKTARVRTDSTGCVRCTLDA